MHHTTYRQLPPILYRNSGQRFIEKPLPPLPDGSFGVKIELIPEPLFSRPITLPPPDTCLAITTPQSPTSFLSRSQSTSSRTSSIRSSNCSIISSTASTASTAPSSTACSSCSRSPSLSYSWAPTWSDSHSTNLQPRRSLRRKKGPTNESLRSLRAKHSDACLQQMYDQQTAAYLDGSILTRVRTESGLGVMLEE